jgi:hypothetical protein
LLILVCNNLGHTWTTPAGWSTTIYPAKSRPKPFTKNQAAAGATGTVAITQSAAGESSCIIIAIKGTAESGGGGETISERLVESNKFVEPFNVPTETATINVAQNAVESGNDANTVYKTVALGTLHIAGTVERPWVAIEALKANGERIGTWTPRLKTSPTAVAPTLTKPATQHSPVGKAVSLQLVATESPTSYAASGLPTNVNINTITGLISGTPSATGTFTVKATATNGTGTSATVEWSWVIETATTGVVTGISSNADSTSAPSLIVVGYCEAGREIRDPFVITTAASTIKERAEFWHARNVVIMPLAGAQSRIPSAAEAKGLGTWATAIAPWGGKYIEFQNETNYPNQLGISKANGEAYGTRAKEAADSILATSTGVKLLVQGSDAGSGNTEWLDGILTAWPKAWEHAAFGGWTIHAYPGQHTFSESDTFGLPMMERMVKRLVEHSDTASLFFCTEWGVPTTNNGRTMTSGQSMNWEEGAKVLEAHKPKLITASQGRLSRLYLYQDHDQQPDNGTDTEREHFFGAVQSSGAEKGAFSTFAKAFL